MSRRWLAGLIGLSWLALLVAGCRQPTPTPAPTPTPTPDPRAILREAGAAMQALRSVHFDIARTGGPVYFDAEQTLVFRTAVGDYAAPDAIQASVAVQGPGLNLQLNTIAVGDTQWLSNPLTRRWEQLPPGWGFNPAILFDPEQGWQALLAEDVTAVSSLETAQLDEQTVHFLRATVAGPRIRTITAGLAQDEVIEVEIWLEPASRRVLQLYFTTASAGDEPSDWLIRFSSFDADVTVNPPAGG